MSFAGEPVGAAVVMARSLVARRPPVDRVTP
jgi:hypothetical protein